MYLGSDLFLLNILSPDSVEGRKTEKLPKNTLLWEPVLLWICCSNKSIQSLKDSGSTSHFLKTYSKTLGIQIPFKKVGTAVFLEG